MLGGNAFLKIDQVGIPKDICKFLTKLMIVNSLNYDQQIEISMFMLYLVDLDSLSRFNKVVSKLGYTVKALLSFLLPKQLWHKMSKIRIENGISGSSLI